MDGQGPGAQGPGVARAALLLELEDRLRPLESPAAILAAAARLLGQALGAQVVRALDAEGRPLAIGSEGGAVEAEDTADLPLGEQAGTLSVGGRAWTPEEQDLLREVARRAGAAVARAEAVAGLRASEARARARADDISAMYAHAPIGLCVLDREGRYLRISDALTASNGLPPEAHLGRTVREVVPGLADAIEPALARVLAGEELRGIELSGTTPGRAGLTRTWRESWAPLRDAEGAVIGATIVVEEIAGRTAEERRHAYLLRLEERLRAAPSVREVLDAACATLGSELGVTLVGLGRVEEDGETVVIESEWRRGESRSALGRHRLDDYGEARVADLRAGVPVIVADTATEPREEVRARDEAFGVRAAIELPLLHRGDLRGYLFVCDGRPRSWTTEELALVQETADRTWQAAERARVEAELRESEARFRQLAETIREVFYVLEIEEGRMSYVSPAYEEVWGRSLTEVYADARTFMQSIHPEDRGRVLATTDRLWGGEAVSEEYRVLRPDGSVRHIHDRAVLVADAATGRRRAIGLAADITDRKQVEERLHLATEAAGIGIFDVDLRTGEIEWDGRLRDLWGVAPDIPITDALFQEGIHPEDREVMRAGVARALDPGGDGLYRAEYRLRPGPDGTAPWIAAAGQAHFDGGRPVRLIGTVQDVTARKLAEAAVAESEALFRALAGTVPALIFLSEPRVGNVYANARYQDYAGLAAEDLMGFGWRRAIHPEDLPRADAAWAHSFATGGEYVVELRVRRQDGIYRWHLLRGAPVRDASGRIVQWVGAGTDIEEIVEAREALAASRAAVEEARAGLEQRVAERTASLAQANARLAAEIERREATQAALVQSQKLEAVGQLTSGIAHDFNNVIAAIAGGFSVIERRTADPRLLEVARHGAKAAERGGALVKQLLAFAREQVLAPRACDLNALLREAEPLIARSVGPGVELDLDCPPAIGEIRIDPVQLESALINLAVNARDAMEGRGRLSIMARLCPEDEPGRPDELAGRAAVAIAVADTGSGIAPEILGRVFEPFFTTKAPGRGTGLGLAMVHGFVHQSGGALRLESRPGEGTSVTLFLPRVAAAEAGPAPARPPAPSLAPLAGTGRILLVDDDAAVRGVTAAQVADLGYAVQEAEGAAEALSLLEAAPAPDLVLTDVAMPGQDGLALAAELRRRWPGLPVLFMTGHADQERLRGETVLRKPFTLNDLAATLARAVGAARP